MNVEVASQVTKQLKILDHEKLRNFEEIPEKLGIDGKSPAGHFKSKILAVVLKNCQKPAVKHFKEKPILLNVVKLSLMFCPWLS